MPTTHIVVIGASAGGLEALRELVASLPADFPAPICVVLHTAPHSPGLLDTILSRAGKLPATNGIDRERLKPGHIYVAPPDCHMLVEPGIIRVTKGPRENRSRPAIDPLFRSAAQIYGPGAIGVVLSGSLDDGTDGLWTVKQLGGTAIVQDPRDALFPDMPRNASEHVKVDHSVPLAAIGPLLVRLTSSSEPREASADSLPGGHHTLEMEVNIAKEAIPRSEGLEEVGTPSRFACPDCHGVLLQLKEGARIRFRCHTGHAYSLESLLGAISEGIEESLWIAIRSLEEAGLFIGGLALQAGDGGADAARLNAQAEEVARQSALIRRLVAERQPLSLRL